MSLNNDKTLKVRRSLVVILALSTNQTTVVILESQDDLLYILDRLGQCS